MRKLSASNLTRQVEGLRLRGRECHRLMSGSHWHWKLHHAGEACHGTVLGMCLHVAGLY